ncbi:hypothetical protein AN958_00042 [Leucoagaricus sp. SymC.cos]|nr:hypothetical protein AN958_00042 [Leucoagaricus sp. SymC.cos]
MFLFETVIVDTGPSVAARAVVVNASRDAKLETKGNILVTSQGNTTEGQEEKTRQSWEDDEKDVDVLLLYCSWRSRYT